MPFQIDVSDHCETCKRDFVLQEPIKVKLPEGTSYCIPCLSANPDPKIYK
jgi:hypothetical protein